MTKAEQICEGESASSLPLKSLSLDYHASNNTDEADTVEKQFLSYKI